jgi:hypothetical protein
MSQQRFGYGRGFVMAKNREKQKANKQKGREEQLNKLNEWNMKDLTPYNMVRLVTGKEIAYK